MRTLRLAALAAAVLAASLAVSVLAGCGNGDDAATARRPIPARGSTSARPRTPVPADSTIAARDYIGPSACGDCHPDQHARWRTSLHSVMNQRADARAVIGDFATTLAYAGGEVRFERIDGAPTMTFVRRAPEPSLVRYRVTRTIGVRGLQEYVGIEDGGPGDEVRLPMAWWPKRAGWFPQPYFDPWLDETAADVYAPVREPWAERCPWCHSTYPFEQRIARAAGPRLVGHGLEQHFAPAAAATVTAISTAPPPGTERLAVERQVSVGISCESCHLGGRAHAAGAPIHFVPIGAEPRPGAPVPAAFAVERRDPAIVGAVCAQCHSGPSPRFPDGSALRNSSESLDLAAGPCTGIACTDCHDPHSGGPGHTGGPADLTARAIAACAGCHPGRDGAAHAGGGHDGVSCLDCHMPRVVMGIDRYVRSHRISSPANPAMLAAAAPNACNLCHLDRSIRWTLDELALRPGAAIDPRTDPRLEPRRWTAYPDADGLDGLDASVGGAWLASPVPGIRLLAAAAYGRSPLGRFALRDLARGLDDDLPYVRAWTQFAIEDVLGRRLAPAEYDARAARPARRAQIDRLLARILR